MIIKCCLAVAMLVLGTTTATAQQNAPIPVDTAAMDAHLRFLASDLLEGRAPATRGGRLATAYIAAQFQALGLEPAGAILIHTTESATYPWEVVRGSWSVEQFKLHQPRSPSLAVAGWVQESVARAALSSGGLNLDSLARAAARRDFRPVVTGLQAQLHVQSALRHVASENVAARLPGRDAH